MAYVIIGNSTAAIAAVEGIRRIDRKTPITIISDEPFHTYSRPLISYYLGKKVTEDKMFYRDKDFYKKNNVKTMLGVKAEKINHKKKEVTLGNGDKIGYSKLLISTGGKPFVPPLEGIDKKNIFNFIKFSDVKEIEKNAEKGSKAIVVGASFSGLKAVEALVQRGVNVTVIDIMDRIMPRVLDGVASSIVEKELENNSVNVLLNTTVKKILGRDVATGVLLDGDRELDCDFIILAMGVRCNTDLVKDTGIKTNRGIIVDNFMQTNVPDIYAAGDVTEGYNFIQNKRMETAIIPNAYKQGEIAGMNMTGEIKIFDKGFMMNSMPLLELSIISAGLSEKEERVIEKVVHIPEKNWYKKFYIKGGRLVGYLIINDVDRAGIYTRLIRDEIDISSFVDKIGDDEFGFINFPESLRKACFIEKGVV
ncbi:FAD-dependent oxidoreductase [Herbivorax sp. ANBcel31]|uniref:NAD(P)/FAD-dependent oxidoreductase n=1 Tax=Herbivorax sp. ANBcel31 TaxID=3069754 RepID=UPI0027B1AAF4|nr:FAD-dependent oxidoreductase [Herbivorax sp. ANBcel31]MDQ2086189.1 FAD-dependent oxidoreductase [Herbivorax sp. ANBcel31]